MSRLIELRSVSKRFLLRHNPTGELKVRFLGLFHRHYREIVDELWALKNISLEIGQGESIGLIGRNGSGKSTLLKLVAGIYRPTSGQLLMVNGRRIGTLIELGIGFHPELTGQENVYLNAAIHGLSRADIDALYPLVADYSGLGEFIDVPLKNYSSGMQMRLGFAVAANLNPDILLLDEIFAVGDEDFQKRCQRTVRRFLADGKTILFVSHASAAVRAICRRVCLLDHGQLLYDGEVDGGLAAYQRLMMGDDRTGAPVSDASTAVPESPSAQGRRAAESADLDLSWHRIAVGGSWDTTGALQLDFLRSQGLRPEHYLLDVGCGSLRAGVRLIPYLEPGHYLGLDSSQELIKAGLEIELPRIGGDRRNAVFVINDRFDLTSLPPIDFAIAHALFPFVSLNVVALCIASVVRKLAPGGRFYATYFENPDVARAEPVVHPGGTTTYADIEPYHVSFELLAQICQAAGAQAERIGAWGHPGGQMMACITRKA
jgi:ABC-type polysaccharide/polyol phosphate transport system ATPase subunit/SAM-dependent methyltransferase